jgi:hypothetical protein
VIPTWTGADWYVVYVVMPWALVAMAVERVVRRRQVGPGWIQRCGKRLETCRRCGSVVEVPDGASLRAVRQAAGLGLRAFAETVGVSAAYVCDVELNRRRVTPRMEDAYAALSRRVR